MKLMQRKHSNNPSPSPSPLEPSVPPPKPKPAYKNADRATYFRDEITGEKYYKCPYCPKRLKGHLTIHLRTHTGRKPWNCSKCSKKFSQKCNLQTHIKAVHSSPADKIFKCELCPKSFGYKKNLERHVSSHLLEKPYKCNFCPRRFSAIDYLCKHKRVHTGETPYYCAFCPEVKFSQYFEMMRHLRRHIREKSFVCKFCEKTFMTGENLRSHIRCAHLKVNYKEQLDPVTCLFCEKVVLNKSRLFIHMRIVHLRELPYYYYKAKVTPEKYKCEEDNCGRVYKNRKAWKRHWNRCHLQAEEWPYYCVFCGRRFLELSYFRDHLAIKHTKERPEECQECSKTFPCKWAKREHIRKVHPEIIGKGNKYFSYSSCKICGIKCKSKKRLNSHFLRRHTGNEVVRLERINVNATYEQ